MLCPTIDETMPSNNDPADHGRSPAWPRASPAMMGSSNFGIVAFVPRTSAAHSASRSQLLDPEISRVCALICRTERQATCPASQPTQTKPPFLASTFGHRPRAHHAGATVLASSNGDETVNSLLGVWEKVTALLYEISPLLLASSGILLGFSCSLS